MKAEQQNSQVNGTLINDCPKGGKHKLSITEDGSVCTKCKNVFYPKPTCPKCGREIWPLDNGYCPTGCGRICPECDGEGWSLAPSGGNWKCPTCKGKKVV